MPIPMLLNDLVLLIRLSCMGFCCKKEILSASVTSSMIDLWYITHWPLTRYLKLWVAHSLGMPGTFSPHRLQRKPLVKGPGMHHVTCIAHVPWCISGSLTRGGWEDVPDIPGACTTRDFTYLARGPLLGIKSCINMWSDKFDIMEKIL